MAEQSRSVLLADDTAEIRKLLRMAIEGASSFKVVAEADDGAQALRLTNEHRPNVVVMDLAMPVMDGLEAIPQIRKSSPDTKILVLSGFTSTKMEAEAMRVGADAYLEKGASPDRIIAALNELYPDSNAAVPVVAEAETTVESPLPPDFGVREEVVATALDARHEDPLASLAHELMTPLTVIQGFAEVVGNQADNAEPAQIRDWVAAIGRSAQSMAGIIKGFRSVAIFGAEEIEIAPVRVDIGQLVSEILGDLGTLIGDTALEMTLSPGVLVDVDVVKVRQILTNLVSNAVKFSPGSPLTVSQEDGRFYIEIAVCDRGPGVPPKRAGELFKKFARLGASAPGSGLGLYISRQLARAHGGDVVYAPRTGGGSCFKLRLPRVESHA